jgi:phosphomannomutase
MTLFINYDIRGIYPKEIDEDFAYRLGRAMIKYVKCKRVVVGYDGRLSSKKLEKALMKGVTDQGGDIVLIGLSSTPGFYYALSNWKVDGGIMITASHDPKEYNGFKLFKAHAMPIGIESGLWDVIRMMEKNEFKKQKKGKIVKKSVGTEYLKFLSKHAVKTNLKIVLDSSNGTGGLAESEVIKNCAKVKHINSKVSGHFPGHIPNPLIAKNRRQIEKLVREGKANLGIAFDGDADRVNFIDEKGNFIAPDLILALMVKYLRIKSKVLYDVRTSIAVPELVEEQGGTPILCKAGHNYYKDVMVQEKALIGAEKSGHYYFKEFSYMDCAGLAALKVLQILKKEKKPISELIKPLNKYFDSGEINYRVRDRSIAVKMVEKAFPPPKRKITLDGTSLFYKSYWFNIRKSNTEPVIRVNIEAQTREKMLEVKRKIDAIVRAA